MLNALTLLVLCQFAGEVAARGLGLPLPGPVLGLIFLLAGLLLRARLGRGGPPAELKTTAQGLLNHLGLLFVPAADTWHGFTRRRIAGVRRSLIVNYVKPEWRSRHELAFPDQAIVVA